MKIRDLPPHKRPREKLLSLGPSALSEVELLAIVLQKGYAGKNALQLAEELLRKLPLSQVVMSRPQDLCRVKGIGLARATNLVAALHLAQSVISTKPASLIKPEDVAGLMAHLCQYRQEHVVAIYLNARNQIIRQSTISIGTVNSALIHPREVFAPALEAKASAVILVHNHPSNDPQPSEEDILISQKLQEAGELMDIYFLDHVIVSTQGWSSLKQLQLL